MLTSSIVLHRNLATVKYFVYAVDRPGAGQLRTALVEEHWAYMDRFAGSMIARGPTLAPDREAATGSLHIVDLPSDGAARAFAEEEPNFRAGVYERLLLHRFDDLLGRTMWKFQGAGGDRFLIIALGGGAARPPASAERLIVYGALRALGDGSPLGVAACVEASDAEAAARLLPPGAPAVVGAPGVPGVVVAPSVPTAVGAHVRVYPWQFGGRR
jgi:uncharacterized protein YciI